MVNKRTRIAQLEKVHAKQNKGVPRVIVWRVGYDGKPATFDGVEMSQEQAASMAAKVKASGGNFILIRIIPASVAMQNEI